MDDGKKKIIFLDEGSETGSLKEGGSEFSDTPQFPDAPSESLEAPSNVTNSLTDPIVDPAVDPAVDPTVVSEIDGGDVSSELSENPNLTTLNALSEPSDNGSEYDGGDLISEGGASDVSDISSVRTSDLLSVDPLYIRLTKFLEADIKLEGGSSKKVNVVDVLHDISISLKDITKSLGDISTYSQKMALEKIKQ